MITTPSFIDLHTHTRYPDLNNFQYQEIENSAKFGGYSDLLAMANSEVAIDNLDNLSTAKEIDDKLNLRIHRVASLSKSLNGEELVDFNKFVSVGIRIFSDDGKSLTNDDLAEQAFKTIAQLESGIFQHCELNCHSNPGDVAPPNFNSELIEIYEEEELSILERDLKLVKKYNTRYHAQHISTKKSVEIISKAKKIGLPVTAEVSPHHLLLSNETIEFFDGTYKMYPPIRNESDRIALVQGLKDGVIDVIATDHAPHEKSSKDTSIQKATFGIVGVETLLAISLELYHNKTLKLTELLAKLTCNPAKIINIPRGEIKKNAVADLTVIDLNKEWLINKDKFHSKSHNTPFHGRKVKGCAVKTFIAGKLVYDKE